jgi:hypothetical protein
VPVILGNELVRFSEMNGNGFHAVFRSHRVRFRSTAISKMTNDESSNAPGFGCDDGSRDQCRVANSAVRKISKKRAIKNAFFRLGLHARPKEVVNTVERDGVQVNEELVRLVRIELLKDMTRGGHAGLPSKAPSPARRRCPKGFPQRRYHG